MPQPLPVPVVEDSELNLGRTAVMIRSFGIDDILLEASRAGAVGDVVKKADDREIVRSLACVEREVLRRVAAGCTNKDVGSKLDLPMHAVDFYPKRLDTNHSAKACIQAVNLARASGLL